MNPALEALLQSFDAYKEASEEDRRARWNIYQSRLDDAFAQFAKQLQKLIPIITTTLPQEFKHFAPQIDLILHRS